MPVSVKGANYTYGAAEVSVSGMVVESATVSTAVQVDEEGIDENGMVAAWALGGKNYELTASGIYQGAGPSVESDMSIDGISVTVTKVERSWGNRDWKKATVTGKGYEGVS